MNTERRLQAPGTTALICACACAFMATILGGCGGGGGNGGGSAAPQGALAFRSAAIATDQSLAVGLNFPLAMLKATGPRGSAVTRSAAFARPGTLAVQLTPRAAMMRPVGTRAGGLTPNTVLGLYALDPVVTGNAMVTQFFTDPAGTQSAGSITLVKQGVTNFADDYRSYPATADGVVNLTAGNVPCRGNVSIVYVHTTPVGAQANGANTMTGHLDLTRNTIGIDLNLALSDALNVSGSAVITENGQTVRVTDINGPFTSRLSCAVKIDPQGWTGTGNFSLVDGTFNMTVNAGGGTDTAQTDATGNLNMAYADGRTEVIHAPLLAALSGSLGSNPGGGTGNPYPGYYKTPIAVAGRITGINAAGQMVGDKGFYSSPAATPQPLPVPAGATVALTGINASGQIIGVSPATSDSPTGGVPLFWSSPTAQPVVLKPLTAGAQTRAWAINSHGQILGTSATPTNTFFTITPIYWSDATSAPRPLPFTFNYDPAGNFFGSYDPSTSFFIADDGTMLVLFGYSSQAGSAVFKAPASATDPIQGPFQLKSLPGDNFAVGEAMSANGMIAGYSEGNQRQRVTWTSAAAVPQLLPSSNTSVDRHDLFSINSSGAVVGAVRDTGYTPVLCQDGKSLDVNTLLPPGTTNTFALALLINDSGVVVVANGYPGAPGQYFVLVPR